MIKLFNRQKKLTVKEWVEASMLERNQWLCEGRKFDKLSISILRWAGFFTRAGATVEPEHMLKVWHAMKK